MTMLTLSASVQESLGDDAKVSQDVMRQAGMPVSAEDKAASETEGEKEVEKERAQEQEK